MLHLTLLSLISAKPAAEPAAEQTQLCPVSVCRWQPSTRYRLPSACCSPTDTHSSLYTTRHINICFINVMHKSSCSNTNGNYCGYKDNYSVMAAPSNSCTLIGLLLETDELLSLPATSTRCICSISNTDV